MELQRVLAWESFQFTSQFFSFLSHQTYFFIFWSLDMFLYFYSHAAQPIISLFLFYFIIVTTFLWTACLFLTKNEYKMLNSKSWLTQSLIPLYDHSVIIYYQSVLKSYSRNIFICHWIVPYGFFCTVLVD